MFHHTIHLQEFQHHHFQGVQHNHIIILTLIAQQECQDLKITFTGMLTKLIKTLLFSSHIDLEDSNTPQEYMVESEMLESLIVDFFRLNYKIDSINLKGVLQLLLLYLQQIYGDMSFNNSGIILKPTNLRILLQMKKM